MLVLGLESQKYHFDLNISDIFHTGCHSWRKKIIQYICWFFWSSKIPRFPPQKDTLITSWWFQSIWKYPSNSILSPSRGENKSHLKPPPNCNSPTHPPRLGYHESSISNQQKHGTPIFPSSTWVFPTAWDFVAWGCRKLALEATKNEACCM